MYRLKKLSLACMFAAAIFTGCDDDEKRTTFGVENEAAHNQTVFGDQTSGTEVNLVTPGAWTSSITTSTVKSTETETEEWISITPDHGDEAGSYKVAIIVKPNFSGDDREATITFWCNSEGFSISVTQKTTTANGNPYGVFPSLLTAEVTGVTTATAVAGGRITHREYPPTQELVCAMPHLPIQPLMTSM